MYPILYKGMLWGMPISISAYWLMGLLAASVMVYASYTEFRNQQIRLHLRLLIISSVIVAFFIGARLYFVLLYWPLVMAKPHLIYQFKLVNFGLYGGLIAAILIFVPFAKYTQLNFWKFSDHLTPYAALAIGFSKLGCFLNGCCYGIPTNAPWGINFPRAQAQFFSPQSLFSMLTNHTVQLRHPTQIYEIIASAFALLLAFLVVKYTNKHRPEKAHGLLALWFAINFTLFRFFIFYLRDFPSATSISQLIRGPLTYGLVLLVVLLMLYKRMRVK